LSLFCPLSKRDYRLDFASCASCNQFSLIERNVISEESAMRWRYFIQGGKTYLMNEWNAETAEWYAANYGEYATNRLAVEALELEPDSLAVDVGCGTGAALRHAASKITQGRLIGVDPVPRMIEIAQERTAGHPAAPRIEFRVGSAEDLPVDDAAADVVLAFDSFDHWQDRARGLNEIRRILSPAGKLVVVKDASVPGARGARRAFVGALARAGFVVSREERIEGDDVRFTLWICEAID
jgi:SAM-dependent methyltransferase